MNFLIVFCLLLACTYSFPASGNMSSIEGRLDVHVNPPPAKINWQLIDQGHEAKEIFDLCKLPGIWLCDYISMFSKKV